jgi:hypothetical protein
MLVTVMPSRYDQLKEALDGFRFTGIPLIAQTSTGLRPAGFGDDIGAYYFIPKLALILDVTLDQAITIFYAIALVSAVALGSGGFILLFRSWKGIVLAPMALTMLSYIFFARIGDVYLISLALPIAIIPLFLYLAKIDMRGILLISFSALAGLFIGLADYVRAHAGTALFFFLGVAAFWHLKLSRLKRVAIVGALIAGVLLGHAFFQVLIAKRDRYLSANLSEPVVLLSRHPVWHSIYIGLGFLNNDYGLAYLDEVAIKKVHSLLPTARYLSEDYENALRREVVRLISIHPVFFVRTLFAKAGVVVMYILLSVNVGFIAAWYRQIPSCLMIAFWGAIFLSSVTGLLIIPKPEYLAGMMAFGVLYGVYSVNYLFEPRPSKVDTLQ